MLPITRKSEGVSDNNATEASLKLKSSVNILTRDNCGPPPPPPPPPLLRAAAAVLPSAVAAVACTPVKTLLL